MRALVPPQPLLCWREVILVVVRGAAIFLLRGIGRGACLEVGEVSAQAGNLSEDQMGLVGHLIEQAADLDSWFLHGFWWCWG